jgi:hypothetical protein
MLRNKLFFLYPRLCQLQISAIGRRLPGLEGEVSLSLARPPSFLCSAYALCHAAKCSVSVLYPPWIHLQSNADKRVFEVFGIHESCSCEILLSGDLDTYDLGFNEVRRTVRICAVNISSKGVASDKAVVAEIWNLEIFADRLKSALARQGCRGDEMICENAPVSFRFCC